MRPAIDDGELFVALGAHDQLGHAERGEARAGIGGQTAGDSVVAEIDQRVGDLLGQLRAQRDLRKVRLTSSKRRSR